MAGQSGDEEQAPSFANLRSRFEALAGGRSSGSPRPPVSSSQGKLAAGLKQVPALKLADVDLKPAQPAQNTPPLSSPELLRHVPGVLEALKYAESEEAEHGSASLPPSVPPKTPSQLPLPPSSDALDVPPPVPERPNASLLAASSSASPPAADRDDDQDRDTAIRALSSTEMLLDPSLISASLVKSPPSPGNGQKRVPAQSTVETLQAKSAAALHRFHSLHTHSHAAGTSRSTSKAASPSSSSSSLPKTYSGIIPPPQRSSTSAAPPSAARLDVPQIRKNRSASNSGTSSPMQMTDDDGEHDDDRGSEENSSDSEDIEKDVLQAMGPSGMVSARASEELPDATRANRKPPHYVPVRSIASKGHTSCVAVCGDVLVSGHHDKLRIARAKDGWEGVQHYISIGQDKREIKLCALAFRPSSSSGQTAVNPSNGDSGRFVWCGTKEGDLLEFDIKESRVSDHKQGAHTAAVILLQSVGRDMISVDEGGKICTWIAKLKPADKNAAGPSASLKEPAITQRVVFERHSCAMVLGDELWVASVGEAGTTNRTCKVRIYRPFTVDKPFNAVSRPVVIPEALAAGTLGAVSSGAVVPLHNGHVYLGHQSGHISIWSRSTYSCVAVLTTAMSGITSLSGVRGWFLWAGSRQGQVRIFDVREKPWQVVKVFDAHKGSAVTQLTADPSGIGAGRLQVLSSSVEGDVCLWDGLLTSDWMTQELERRLPEYSSFRQMTALHITFNIDAASTVDFEGSELPGLDVLDTMSSMPDVIVVGFQELVDLQDTRIMAKSLLLGGARRSRGHDVGERLSHQARAWTQRISQDIRKKVMQWNAATASDGAASSSGGGDEKMYELVLQDSLVGLFTAVFVKEKETINVRQAAIASIKTGFGGRMGNKGAIIASLLIDDTPVAWVNCHLAAGQQHTRERNADLVNIFESQPFSERAARSALATAAPDSKAAFIVDDYAGGGDGAMIMPDHEIVFLSGDLNYRIDMARGRCLDLINKKDWQGLLARDQLLRQLRDNPGHRLRPFHEAAITFAPTYKYDRRTSTYDTSEKQRVPAYCDRIVWYARSEQAHVIQCQQYKAERRAMPSDHRPVVAVFTFQVRNSDPARRSAVLDELEVAWKVAQAERLRSAKEFYFSGR